MSLCAGRTCGPVHSLYVPPAGLARKPLHFGLRVLDSGFGILDRLHRRPVTAVLECGSSASALGLGNSGLYRTVQDSAAARLASQCLPVASGGASGQNRGGRVVRCFSRFGDGWNIRATAGAVRSPRRLAQQSRAGIPAGGEEPYDP
jgi:hypothetical protein